MGNSFDKLFFCGNIEAVHWPSDNVKKFQGNSMKNFVRTLVAVSAFVFLALLGGCSSVGFGLANHPGDCAMGIPWADCLPGTAGYSNGGGKIHKEEAQQQQDAVSAPLKSAADQCREDAQSPALDPIRSKVELIKSDPNMSPPFEVATNEAFPSESERPVIAAWAKIRESCTQRMSSLPRLLPSASPLQVTTDRKARELELGVSAEVNKLIVALYQQKMTYGEFAQRRYEIGRDGAKALTDFKQSVLLADRDHQEKAQQVAQDQYNAKLAAWSAYNQSVAARQPQTVRLINSPPIPTSVNCTSYRTGNMFNTNCN